MIVSTKKQAYELASQGAFGNVVPRWFVAAQWLLDAQENPMFRRQTLWGVQTTRVPGGPAKLDVPTDEVGKVFFSPEFQAKVPVISPMVHQVGTVTLMGDCWDSPDGIEFNGFEYPASSQWRKLMVKPNRYTGTAARTLLRRHLNENSFDDLMIAFERFPGAVYELSALDVCYGTVPHRNAVCWEIRHY